MLVYVPGHHGPHKDVLPPRSLFDEKIERDAAHDYWLGEFRSFDGLNRFATLRWAPDGETHTTIYVVARALWVYVNNIYPGEPLKLRNTCGLVTCVRPDHVERILVTKRCMLSKALMMHDGATLVPRGGHTVHLCPSDVTYALCGYRYTSRATYTHYGSEITCRSCVDAAHSSGYVLEEYRGQ